MKEWEICAVRYQFGLYVKVVRRDWEYRIKTKYYYNPTPETVRRWCAVLNDQINGALFVDSHGWVWDNHAGCEYEKGG